MKSLLSLLVLSTIVLAQPSAVRRLNSTLLMLKDGTSREQVSRQLEADIAAVADVDHRPTAKLVKAFVDEIVAALPARNLSAGQLSLATSPIVEVLHSAGTSTIGFHETVARAEKALLVLGVPATQARSIAERLLAIGKQVRGPEGVPLHGAIS